MQALEVAHKRLRRYEGQVAEDVSNHRLVLSQASQFRTLQSGVPSLETRLSLYETNRYASSQQLSCLSRTLSLLEQTQNEPLDGDAPDSSVD